ncbi:HDOD domain-containing protein [Oceanidesulfovibrio marinus]|uniref:HDOD domain-containing protein n=1 Tax=Oceanidesulfovibrio marinus TaxID=370038 RepID=A0A6P1ZFJ6_9BACT|nr:HDOD domain-containing protein [Oceanidesulfovibrio marinus]QJT07902.1 HDOD domain-containing protein [Oceanidesulfovibrio marinus]TVM33402.1 HDOD domain-containing protein [Oceanidesulfovibrio marinus]
MGLINVSDLKEGMVLDADLVTPKGRFLLGKGVPITNKHITIMKSWGVTEADIAGASREDAAAETIASLGPECMSQAANEVDTIFAKANSDHPAVAELKRLCTIRTAQAINRGEEIRSPKPLSPLEKDDFRRLRRMQMETPTLADLVTRHVSLVSFPDIYVRIAEVLNDPLSSASHLADVVAKDPSLSTKLLRLVNSPFYGFPAKIESISRAISLIGSRDVTNLALGISVLSYFEMIPPDSLDVHSFWLHSITTGIVARTLASQKVGLTEERFFVAGLIHDIGRLTLIKEMPEQFRLALLLSRVESMPLHEAEREVFGYNHAQVGGMVFKKWRFPTSLERPVRFHHKPESALNLLEPAIIHIADIIAVAMHNGMGGSYYVPELYEEAWDILGLTTGVLQLALTQSDRHIGEIERTFFNSDIGRRARHGR